MIRAQRVLLGFTVTCLCFFLSMIVVAPTDLAAEVINPEQEVMGPFLSDPNQVPNHGKPTPFPNETDIPEQPTPTETLTPTPSLTPTPTPTPTPSPTPTLSPTPTMSPTPTVSPTPTLSPTPTISPTPTPAPLKLNFTMPAVTTNLHIRKGPGTNYSIIGKLPVMTYAFILEESQNGWTKIATGSIEEGYVSSDYLFTQEEVISLCDREELVTATSTAGLNVRKGPGTYYDVMTKIVANTTRPVVLSESYDGWYAIRLSNNQIGYVSADYVELSYALDTGLTMREIERIRDLENMAVAFNLVSAEEAERVEANMLTSIKETKRTPVSMTEAEIELFATIICTEAGDQSYEGMLAVANVILNRMEDGYWGTTLEEVVFAEGQFAGSAPELMARAKKFGIPKNCYKAAREACAGRNNIGDFMFFRSLNSAYKNKAYSKFTKFYILQDHVFYARKWN